MKWELVNKETYPELGGESTERLRVPGGWLVRTGLSLTNRRGLGTGVALCFLPDPEHEWEVG